jgi:hypothetical protein
MPSSPVGVEFIDEKGGGPVCDYASASGRGSPNRRQGLPGGLGKTNCVKDAKEASDIGVRLGTPRAAERSYLYDEIERNLEHVRDFFQCCGCSLSPPFF